jgi:hypothetical protein
MNRKWIRKLIVYGSEVEIELRWKWKWICVLDRIGSGVRKPGWEAWIYGYDSFRVGPGCEHDIGWAEATAVELGLRLALHLGLSERANVKGQPILVRSDNAGVVMAINKGRSRNQPTNVILKEIYLLQVISTCMDIKLTYLAIGTPWSTSQSRACTRSNQHLRSAIARRHSSLSRQFFWPIIQDRFSTSATSQRQNVICYSLLRCDIRRSYR